MRVYNRIFFDGQVGLIIGVVGGFGLVYSWLLVQCGVYVVMQDVGVGMDGMGGDLQWIVMVVVQLDGEGLMVQVEFVGIVSCSDCYVWVVVILQQYGWLDFIIYNVGWVQYQLIDVLDEDGFDLMMVIVVKVLLWLV